MYFGSQQSAKRHISQERIFRDGMCGKKSLPKSTKDLLPANKTILQSQKRNLSKGGGKKKGR